MVRLILLVISVILPQCLPTPFLDPPPIENEGLGSQIEALLDIPSEFDSSKGIRFRTKRAFGQDANRDKACQMLIAIDEPLFKHYGEDIKNLTGLSKELVQRVNELYFRTIFRSPFQNLYFRIKEIRVLFDFCTDCNHTQEAYLKAFSDFDFSDFCLAHVFTYRDFPEGVQGLAWKGTVCHGKYNTGFTTLLNHQVNYLTFCN